MGLRLTTVWMRVGAGGLGHRAHHGDGPMARTKSTGSPAVDALAQRIDDEPLASRRAVVGGDDELVARRAELAPRGRGGFAGGAPRMEMTWLPAFLRATAVG